MICREEHIEQKRADKQGDQDARQICPLMKSEVEDQRPDNIELFLNAQRPEMQEGFELADLSKYPDSLQSSRFETKAAPAAIFPERLVVLRKQQKPSDRQAAA